MIVWGITAFMEIAVKNVFTVRGVWNLEIFNER